MKSFLMYTFLSALCMAGSVQAQVVYPGGGSGSYTTTMPPGPYPLKNPYPILNRTHHFQNPTLNRWFMEAHPKVVPGFTKPIQTNDWWSAHMWDFETDSTSTPADTSGYGGLMYTEPGWRIAPYGMANHPHPLSLKGRAYGVDISSQNGFFFTPDTKTTGYNNIMHLNIGIDKMLVPSTIGTQVVDYGDWTAKILWDDKVGNSLEMTSGHGIPYVYFKKTGGDVNMRYTGSLNCWTQTPNGMAVTINDGSGSGNHHYAIFFPVGTVITGINVMNANNPASVFIAQDENETKSATPYVPSNSPRPAFTLTLPPGKNYFSVAVLPDNNAATFSLFEKHAFAFVKDSKVSWNYNEAAGTVTSTFALTTEVMEGTETNAIQALYRHQFINSSDINTSYSYTSARGEMKVLTGNTFTTSLKHYGLIPNMPYAGNYDKAYLTNLFDKLSDQTSFFWEDYYIGESYEDGKKLGRYADLIPLAKQNGSIAAYNALLDTVKRQLQNWFTATPTKNNKVFYYESEWNTLAAYPVGYMAAAQLNDHHFHYGYFIKAAAMVERFEPGWSAQWGPMVEMLIKDVNNWDRSDTQFPFLRFFDPYAGHSWASGHANFLDGNNQESATEAINFATAVALWGAVTKNNTLRDLGIYLATTEISSIEQYWWNKDGVSNPAGYAHTTSALIWGNKSEYRTWFPPGDPRHIHGINYLPVTGASLFLGYHPTLVSANYNELLATEPLLSITAPLGTGLVAPKDWRDVTATYIALDNPSIAKSYESTLIAEPDQPYAGPLYPYAAFDGTSWQMTHHWIATLDSIGKVDLTTADFATTNVFYKNDCKHYVIYNPPGYPSRTVNFSDGRSFKVEVDTLQVFYWCNILPVELLSFEANKNGNVVDLHWSTASEKDNSYFDIERSIDGKTFFYIGRLKGNGNASSISNYNSKDINPSLGTNYYRLKQVDLDGKYTYSNIVAVDFNTDTDQITIFPNPFNQTVSISISGIDPSESMTVEIFDVAGKQVYNQICQSEPKLTLNLPYLAAGTYYMKVSSNTGVKIAKLIKQ